MKKIISLIIVFNFTLILSPNYIQAVTDKPIVYLDSTGIDQAKEAFTLPIKTTEGINDTGIFTFSVVIKFDKEVVEATNISGNSIDGKDGIKVIDNQNGVIIYWYTLNSKAFKDSADKTLAIISFKRLKIGIAKISIDDSSEFYKKDSGDYISNLIDVEFGDSQYKSSVDLALGSVKKPSFDYSTDIFSSTMKVRFAERTDGASIYYTTTNSVDYPDELYDGPFTISNTVTVRAVAEINGVYSDVSSKKYTRIPHEPGGGSPIGGGPIITIPVTNTPPSSAKKFIDIEGHWAKQYIEMLTSKDIINGYEDDTIKPDNRLTRAEAAKIIVTAIGLPATANPKLTFADASQIDEWARGYIQTAFDKGIIKGYEDNTFKANQSVSRKELVVLAVRAFSINVENAPPLSFVDSELIPDWASQSVAVAVKRGIIAGYEDNTFKPDVFVTRAETSKIISMCLEK